MSTNQKHPKLQDVVKPQPVLSQSHPYRGHIVDLVVDQVDLGEAGVVTREYVQHPGAVATVAMDDAGQVLLLRQYRHAVRSQLWEIPAGLLDAPGEDPCTAAQRELAEEADLHAAQWDILADFYTSPGISTEAIRIFLARDLSQIPVEQRHLRQDEERDIITRWIPLQMAVAAVLRGELRSPSAVVGLLAADQSQRQGWSTLRLV